MITAHERRTNVMRHEALRLYATHTRRQRIRHFFSNALMVIGMACVMLFICAWFVGVIE